MHDPLGRRGLFPLRAGRCKQRVGLALDDECEHARIGRAEPARRRWQAHTSIATRDKEVGIRAAMRNRRGELVAATGHRDVDRPIARLRQQSLPGFEGHGRDHDGIDMGVVDLGIASLGRHDQFARQRHLETGRRALEGQRLRVDDLGFGVEDEGGIPLVRRCRRPDCRRGAQRRRRHAGVAALGSEKVGSGADFHRLGLNAEQRPGTEREGETASLKTLHCQFLWARSTGLTMIVKALS